MVDVERKTAVMLNNGAQRQRRGGTQLFPWENHVVEEY